MPSFERSQTLQGTPGVATVGTLIGQPARAQMLLLMLDGRGRTATELAESAGVTRSTASFHLAQLVDGRLVRVDRQGRHRYFRLAGPEIASLLKTMLAVSGAPAHSEKRFGPRPTTMRRARMCYDHMAGELGIGVTDGLIRSGALIESGDDFQLTPAGARQLTDFGIDVAATRQKKRHFARTCIDWSERRPHLAGALGAAIAHRIFELNWARREPGGRTVYVTQAGQQGLSDVFGFDFHLEPGSWEENRQFSGRRSRANTI
ncbi:MAG TPA: helix-turn-helix domain-containing protein [Thermomicrobiales bacterium]|nr:helix-turn-helix domain-containing protein [Thermomicrobiales bacterium]